MSATKGEVLAMCLARRAGIDAAEARLVDSDGASVSLIRRFDWTAGGGRLMYISAATMLGAERADPGEHSYTEIVDALRQRGRQAAADIEQLWRRIAFSVLITNVDDHLLNTNTVQISILMAFSMLTGGGDLSVRRRIGKLLILRLTPRLLRRWSLRARRSCRISSSTRS